MLHQHQDHLPHLDHGYSQCWLPSSVQLNDNFTGEVQRTERNLNQVQQNIESDLATAQELRTEIQQLSLALSASQVPSYGSTSTDAQLTHARSAQSTARKPKRKSKILRELEPHDETPEPELEPLSETFQPTHTDSAHPVLPKPKYDSKMLRELEDHNKSPEPASESEQAKLQHETTRSKSQPTSPKSCRKSLMLREIEAHNRSPEPGSGLEIATICALKNDWRDVTLTRSARKDLLNFIKDKPPTPRKNLNLDTLMLAELNGMDRGRETFHTESSDNHGPSSYRKQQNVRKEVSFGDEEEDEEEDLPKDIKTNGRSNPQPMPTRRTMPWQVERSIRNSQQNQKLAAEFAWWTWDNRKGQSALALYCIPPFRALRLSDPAIYHGSWSTHPNDTHILIYMYTCIYIHTYISMISLLTLLWEQGELMDLSNHPDTTQTPHSKRWVNKVARSRHTMPQQKFQKVSKAHSTWIKACTSSAPRWLLSRILAAT